MAISIVNLKLTLQNVGVLLVLTLKNINIFRKESKTTKCLSLPKYFLHENE